MKLLHSFVQKNMRGGGGVALYLTCDVRLLVCKVLEPNQADRTIGHLVIVTPVNLPIHVSILVIGVV